MINYDFYNKDIWRQFHERFNSSEEYLGTQKRINKKKPIASVCVPAYNHEEFIEECILSILEQKTDFEFEILIGEDGSKDRTRSIVKEYAEKHTDKIRLFLRDRKTSQYYNEDGRIIFRYNHKWLRKSARGKFVALCDGDDYWIDSKKLQKQVDFLTSHNDYSMCYHNAKVIHPLKNTTYKFSNLTTGEYKGSDILFRWIVPTSSVVYRSTCLSDDQHMFNENFMFGDIILFLTLAERGKLWYQDEIMSVYRRHKQSATTNALSDTEGLKKFLIHHKEIDRTFSGKYKQASYKNLSWTNFRLFTYTVKSNLFKSIRYLIQSFHYSKNMSIRLLGKFIITGLKN